MVTPTVEVSSFRGVLSFLDKLGVYDVVLPFLLVFTLVFAILEKTRIFGMDKIEGKDITKKNLNGMTAFVIAFFVVASVRLVGIINEVVSNVVLLLVLSICFLLLVGSFHTGSKEFFLEGGWNTAFTWIMFVGIVLIFLNALGWLEVIYSYLFYRFDTTVVSSIVLVIVLIGFIFFVTKSPSEKKKDKKEE